MASNNDTITDIGKLVFFSEKGYEIPVERVYTIEWEIIPDSQVADNFISNPKGHFIIDIADNNTVLVEIDDSGKIINCPTTIKYEDGTTETITDVKEIIAFNKEHKYTRPSTYVKNRSTGKYEAADIEVVDKKYNNVKLTFNLLAETIEKVYPIHYIFKPASDVIVEEVTTIINEDTSEEDTLNYVKVTELNLEDVTDDMTGSVDRTTTFINLLIEQNFDSYEQVFPGVRYQGIINQDKVSTEFVSTNTIIILEQQEGTDTYQRPMLGDSQYKLLFEFQKDSEMRFISSNSVADIIWENSVSFDLDANQSTDNKAKLTPIYFSVGFISEVEGCYQNIMAMYIMDSNNKKYLIGLFTFLTEVEGEDERYRALLGNLGIPDPIKYPNVFKSQDPIEQGVDWTLINEKSKELMINYENMFPYVGTYKALLLAIRFLGYFDLVFKEWYKIKDSNLRDKYVAILTYDLQKGISLKSKLKQIGVSYGDFERYKKINRLTMVYHLNEIDYDSGETLDIWTKRNNYNNPNQITTAPESGLYKASKTIHDTTHQATYDEGDYTSTHLRKQQFLLLPVTYKIYEYRTDEILAKLRSVKIWLEKYILGANCYIADICGEGIILERLKNPAYVTQHYIRDFTTVGKFTPKIINGYVTNDSSSVLYPTLFIESESTVRCSLNEFDSLTFEDYEDYSIDSFILKETDVNGKHIYISAPLETLVVANEYQFELINNNVSSGTLAEFTDSNFIDNPILILDNKLLFFSDSNNISKIDKDELPIIEITQGNLRFCHGNWKSNIAFSINVTVDLKTGREYFTMYDEETGDIFYKGVLKVFLYPFKKNRNYNKYKYYWAKKLNDTEETRLLFDGEESVFVYTALTKWNVPMLIIRNYKCGNNDEVITGDFILEIIKGRILFRNHKKEINHGKAEGCEIIFGEEFENREQPITVNYKYLSERVPIYTFDKDKLTGDITEDKITECVSTNRYVDISVNRLGVYSVQVLAFDKYNNIYVNNSDDYTTISAKPIEIDTILNTEFVKNDPDFFDNKNTSYIKLNETEITDLLFDSSTYASTPLYPLNYRIYDVDTVTDASDCIEYDNISYAISVPKTGDFVIFNNFTEKVTYIDYNGTETYRISLLDENPNVDTIIHSSYIGLCIYDNLQKDILADIYPLKVMGLNLLQGSKYRYDVNNSYIEVLNTDIDSSSKAIVDELIKKCKETATLNSSSYFINSINAYIYTANEYIIYNSKDKVNDISVDYKNKLTYIYDDTQHYVEDLVIKICYTNDVSIHNHYTKNSIDNEQIFRVINVSDPADSSYIYTIDGIIDMYKLNNKIYHNKAEHYTETTDKITKLDTSVPYKIKMCPAHLRAALYILRVNGFAEEMTYQYNKSTVMRTQVQYVPDPLFFNDYIDTTYSCTFYDYDPKMLLNIWTNLTYNTSDGLYCYRDTPVTINKGRIITMLPNRNQTTLSYKFNDTYIPLKVTWDWKSYVIEDESNWHSNLDLIGQQTIFRSANKILTVRPELLGTLTTTMTCCDVYGNRLINKGSGFVYVDNKNYVVIPEEKGTRDIYYKDVFIVGFESFFEPTSIISAFGETKTFAIVETGASVKSDVQPLGIRYKIYYSDGTVEENTGADVNLLNNDKVAKNNRIKKKFGKATRSHKYVTDQIHGKFKFRKRHERDRINPEEFFDIDIKQYGTSLTNSIYGLSFKLKELPSDGIEKIEEYILRDYITDICYTLERTEGEIEKISGKTLSDVNLKISSIKFIHNTLGIIDYIPKNEAGSKQHIGIILIVFQYHVNGIKDVIQTKAFAQVFQQ